MGRYTDLGFQTNPQRTLRAQRTESNRVRAGYAIQHYHRPTPRLMVLIWFLVFSIIIAACVV